MDNYQSEFEETMGKTSKAYTSIYMYGKRSKIRAWFIGIFITAIIVLFIPWTQNIRAVGKVTTLRQEDRPQQINTIIAGKIIEWKVKEGDVVSRGDTIVILSEIKDDYLDPNLLDRTKEQLAAESEAAGYYQDKVFASENQIDALEQEQNLKLKSLDNKLMQAERKADSDSIKLAAAANELSVADRQLEAAIDMYDKGIIALTEFERRKVQHQNVRAKWISAQNDYNNSKQELLIIQLEQNATRQSYAEKMAKVRGELFASQSQISGATGKIAKLNNQFDNYRIRQGQYVVLAPQNGQIIKAKKSGLLEIVKEGEMIAEIVPTEIEKAVELWVQPMDMQLINVGQEVRFVFDGFPALVFTGWPEASFGIFSGHVTAVERNISTNGKFRVLVKENPEYRQWPLALPLGGGAQSFALLNDVPVWYEIWRQINGFPPDFYQLEESAKSEMKK